jgi:hypothetical protein
LGNLLSHLSAKSSGLGLHHQNIKPMLFSRLTNNETAATQNQALDDELLTVDLHLEGKN